MNGKAAMTGRESFTTEYGTAFRNWLTIGDRAGFFAARIAHRQTSGGGDIKLCTGRHHDGNAPDLRNYATPSSSAGCADEHARNPVTSR